MGFRDHLSQVGAVESCSRRRISQGKEGEQEATHSDHCMVSIFLCDGKAPGHSPLITSDGDNTAPAVSHTDCHTLKQQWPGREAR